GTPEQILREIYKIAGEIMGPEWIKNPTEALKKMGNRALEVIKHNIAEGIKARLLMIGEKESKKNRAEADAERKRLLEDLTTESEEFKKQGVEFPKAAHDAMTTLTEYFKKNLASLPPAEQKKLKELMEKAVENPDMTKIIIAMVRERIQHYYKNPGEILPAFNNFLDTLDNVTLEKIRATGVVELEMQGAKYQLASVPTIAAINKALNDSVLGKIGQTQAFQAFNLGMEMKSYYDAVTNAETWTESFKNLSVEIFRRRTPVGGATEAFVHGKYLRMGVEVVYIIFPPLAIPEGLYGMVEGAAEWSVGKMQEWSYEDMVNELYRGAKFEKADNAWKITSLTYKCQSDNEMTLNSRDEIMKLPVKCGAVFQTIIPLIKNHPVLLQYQEMLDKDSVSNGRTGTFPFKWNTSKSKYGEQLLKVYTGKVDEVVLEYFKGVVEQLEKAQAWASGKKLAEVIQIEKELGCTASLIKFNIGYFGRDRYLGDVKKLQTMVDNFNQLKKTNTSILSIKDKWKANDPDTEVQKDYYGKDYTWVKGFFPECSRESIDQKAEDAQKLSARINDAIKKCRSEAEKVMEKEKVTEEILRPLVIPAICLAVYEETNAYITKGCKEDYDKALKDLKGQESDLQIKDISGPDTVCVGSAINYGVVYSRTCDECVTEWSLLEYGEQLSGANKPQVTWTPRFEGSNTLQLKAWASKDAQKADKKAATKDKRVKILSADKCPKIKLKFNKEPMTVQENDLVDISVAPEGSLPEGQKLLEYAWSVDGQRSDKSKGSSFQFIGKGKKGKQVKIGVKARTNVGYTEEFFLAITVSDSDKDVLTVSIMPKELKKLSKDKSETLEADVTRKTNSGRMKYNWTLKVNDDKPMPIGGNDKSVTLDTKNLKDEDKVEVTVLVLDIDNTPGNKTYGEILREGKDTRPFVVAPSGDIVIKLSSVPQEIEDNQTLKVCVESPVPGVGEATAKYSYRWVEWCETSGGVPADWCTTVISSTTCATRSAAGISGKSIKLKVTVVDSFGRKSEKETPAVLVVDEKAKIRISVTPEQKSITNEDSITFVVKVVPLKDSGQLTLNGVQMPAGMTTFSVPVSFKENENIVTVPFTVVDEKGREAETHATVYVTKKADKEKADKEKADKEKADKEKADKEKADKEKADKEKADKEKADKDAKKEPPACSYEYSAWGECSRATKTQTRSVIGMKPAGCVEKGKPGLQQTCDPPPTEEEKRLAFLSCLCRACGGTGGGYFAVQGDCAGACSCFGMLSGWCTAVPTGPQDLVKSCYAGVYGVKDPDAKTLKDAAEE
ncbi:MAG TPA: hypothetical protein VN328_00525, partial [Thermodesulfovibrionales bacterium]|nr:hypothetical protein [Thermodesulfovibrionales bacterium]